MMFKCFIYIEKSESTNDQCDSYLYHTCSQLSSLSITERLKKKAYLRDLIAASGGVILIELDLNRRFFGPCDL